MSARFHHAGLVVPDLEKAADFYKHLLGLEEVRRFSWDPSVSEIVASVIDLKDSTADVIMLKGDGFHFELFKYSAPEQVGTPASMRPCDPGIRHIAFEFDDVAAACDRFRAKGGTLHGDPVSLGHTWAIYGRDPFGNIIELMQPIAE